MAWIAAAQGRSGRRALRRQHGLGWRQMGSRAAARIRTVGQRAPRRRWPMTVGLILRAIGFASSTRIYLASGEIFGGDRFTSPFRQCFFA
ncbi:hypothetical protein E2562_030550 [Oryza meyeriana var. granulata]|uniref:Uncharacterized protein n=1 Tax=Oryza meyeriana var. granulata TaxID=110450 RepID=A0A6G1D9F0_9ORYZ|nr:hypothetical protein E2562_030550 [Oryza meyeriana var. granulata]